MIPVASAIGTVLQIAGVVNDVSKFVDIILRITKRGENISQAELDQIVADVLGRSDRIQSVNPDRA